MKSINFFKNTHKSGLQSGLQRGVFSVLRLKKFSFTYTLFCPLDVRSVPLPPNLKGRQRELVSDLRLAVSLDVT